MGDTFAPSRPDRVDGSEARVTAVENRDVVQRVAGAASAGLLSSSALALFSPLCVASGRVSRALAWLLAHGFEVPWMRLLQLERAQVHGLWESLIPTVSPRRVDVVTESLVAGPSFLVALRHPTAVPSATAYLRALKGPADPTARPEVSLRTHLGAPNLLTSLVHTSDAPGDLTRELQVLVPRVDELEELWRALRVGACRGDSPPPAVSGDVPPPPVAAFLVGLRLRARLLDRLADGASPSLARVLAEVAPRVGRDLEAAERSDPFDPMAGLAYHRRTLRSQRHLLLRAVESDGPTSPPDEHRRLLCRAYAELEAMAEGKAFDLQELTTSLGAMGTPLSTWERVVLASEWATPSPAPA
jgi:nucleoside diphosphate kinase